MQVSSLLLEQGIRLWGCPRNWLLARQLLKTPTNSKRRPYLPDPFEPRVDLRGGGSRYAASKLGSLPPLMQYFNLNGFM